MHSNIEAYPLCWPAGWKRVRWRECSRFREKSFATCRDSLFEELRKLGAKKIILSTNIELRLDGIPYANRPQPADPGVAVYFTYRNRQMVFACDQWIKVEHNIRAVAKTIEAIRGIERWGASDMMERAFTGFQKLSSGNEIDCCWSFLGISSSCHPKDIVIRYRELAKRYHPDHGGDQHKMSKLNAAYKEALKQVGG